MDVQDYGFDDKNLAIEKKKSIRNSVSNSISNNDPKAILKNKQKVVRASS